jgi:hypothetical protein
MGCHFLWLDCGVNLSQEQSKPFVKVNESQFMRGKPLLKRPGGLALRRSGLRAWGKMLIART